jgi:hypothetical protein
MPVTFAPVPSAVHAHASRLSPPGLEPTFSFSRYAHLCQKGATMYRPPGHMMHRLAVAAVVALVSTVLVTAVSSSPYPLDQVALTALPSPALGHANEYSLVPSVIGKSVAAAMAVLKAAKLRTLVHAPSMTARVYRQSPVAGLRVLRGAIVSIWATVPASR